MGVSRPVRAIEHRVPAPGAAAWRGPSSGCAPLVKASLAAILSLASSACAIDNHGVVLGRITHADGALVADLYSVGAHLKTRPGDAGLVLGFNRSSYVFAQSPGQKQIAEGWHAFSVPLPADPPKALHIETAGISAHRNHGKFGMTLGFRAFTLLALVRRDANEVLAVRYRPARPSETHVRYCGEISRCTEQPRQ